MATLVAYASKYGATQGIAERIGAKLREMGQDVKVKSAETVSGTSAYDACVIGSAVYTGSWLPAAREFVRRNRAELSTRPVWLFSSGPLGPKAEATLERPQRPDVVLGEVRIFGSRHTIYWPLPKEVIEFRNAIGYRDHAMFFGALDHKNLPLAERMAIKAVGGMEGDFRDWAAIDAWAEHIAHELTPATATHHQA